MHTLLVENLDWYWDWISAGVLLIYVAFGFKQTVLSEPSTIRNETIGQIIDSPTGVVECRNSEPQ